MDGSLLDVVLHACLLFVSLLHGKGSKEAKTLFVLFNMLSPEPRTVPGMWQASTNIRCMNANARLEENG